MRADPACRTRRSCPGAVKSRSIYAKQTLRAPPGSGGHHEREAETCKMEKKGLARVSRCTGFVIPLRVKSGRLKGSLRSPGGLHKEQEELTTWSRVGRVIELLSS